ncbi:MAG TPA: hypothetical protein EYQ50_09850 [Verrucomicrobiales bacterium]|nr:hypothetical protein [Verrucomicrobiales bacterium]
MRGIFIIGALGLLTSISAVAEKNVFLTETPDYTWYRGCFGTATGNLMGFWDRHGFPDNYTGPTNNGLAPLSSPSSLIGIRSLWATKAGFDGRPTDLPGHDEDYWVKFESTGADPFTMENRPEHSPDCIGDFIGLNQRKWLDLNGECEGNIDGFSFVFWDPSGKRRTNFTPMDDNENIIPDIPSGIVNWFAYRGYPGSSFSQLTDFNSEVEEGNGFTFEDLKAEIDGGYPLLLFLQDFDLPSRNINGAEGVNPDIHALLAYGYFESDNGLKFVRYRDSWGGGDTKLHLWDNTNWEARMPVRGVIGFHPKPIITHWQLDGNSLTLKWQGPLSELWNQTDNFTEKLHWYIVEKSTTLAADSFTAVSPAINELNFTLPFDPEESAVFQVRSAKPNEIPLQIL